MTADELDAAQANLCQAYAALGEFSVTIRTIEEGIRIIHIRPKSSKALARLLRNAADMIDENPNTSLQ